SLVEPWRLAVSDSGREGAGVMEKRLPIQHNRASFGSYGLGTLRQDTKSRSTRTLLQIGQAGATWL
ncbi:MAG: hypothetical protein RKP20_17210, partial [Candidatus Competibacter sp.]|nr:hypothetical protein [Candidatus Competibacter sp.]